MLFNISFIFNQIKGRSYREKISSQLTLSKANEKILVRLFFPKKELDIEFIYSFDLLFANNILIICFILSTSSVVICHLIRHVFDLMSNKDDQTCCNSIRRKLSSNLVHIEYIFAFFLLKRYLIGFEESLEKISRSSLQLIDRTEKDLVLRLNPTSFSAYFQMKQNIQIKSIRLKNYCQTKTRRHLLIITQFFFPTYLKQNYLTSILNVLNCFLSSSHFAL